MPPDHGCRPDRREDPWKRDRASPSQRCGAGPGAFQGPSDDKGELVKDPNGRLVKGNLDRIGAMEKRAGWGSEYPDEMRNGEWECALFGPDGTRNEQANLKACFECHKPNSGKDVGFTFDKLAAPAKP